MTIEKLNILEKLVFLEMQVDENGRYASHWGMEHVRGIRSYRIGESLQ